MDRTPIHDLTGLGNSDGSFSKLLLRRNCGIVVYETRDAIGVTGKMSVSIDKRLELKNWLSGSGPQPVWWSGWPVRRM